MTRRCRGLPGKAELPGEESSRTNPSAGSSTAQCWQGRSGKPCIGQPAERGESVSSRRIFALISGDWLQRPFGRSTWTKKFPPWKILHAQLLKSMRMCPKQYSLTSQSMTLCGSRRSSQAPQGVWEMRLLSSTTGSFASDACRKS